MSGKFCYLRHQNCVQHAAGEKKRASVKSEIRRMGAEFWPTYFFVAAPYIGFRQADLVVYLLGWSCLPALVFLFVTQAKPIRSEGGSRRLWVSRGWVAAARRRLHKLYLGGSRVAGAATHPETHTCKLNNLQTYLLTLLKRT
jgi:hypothetical protein